MKLKEVNRDEVDTIVKRDAPLWETVDIEKVKGELADVVRFLLLQLQGREASIHILDVRHAALSARRL